MKRISLAVITVIFSLAMSSISFANTDRAQITDFPVFINGEEIDNLHSSYPLITYLNVTYFPITWDYANALGLSTEFSNSKGLEIGVKADKSDFVQQLDNENDLSESLSIHSPNFQVSVNGKKIDNENEDYPIFVYRGVTYFPLTWHYVVDEFGWKSEFTEEYGLKISSETKSVNVESPLIFKDGKFKEAIIDLGFDIDGNGEITNSEVLFIKEIELKENDIEFLDGIENFTRLEKLICNRNGISDLDPLRNMDSITNLEVYDNEISDLEVVSTLTKLKDLRISGNDVSDISHLMNLSEIIILDLQDNNISDISVMSNLEKLEVALLNGNSIKNIESLSNLSELTFLHLAQNDIEDIYPIKNLRKLEKLDLDYNPIYDTDTQNARYESKITVGDNSYEVWRIRKSITDSSLSDDEILEMIENGDYEGYVEAWRYDGLVDISWYGPDQHPEKSARSGMLLIENADPSHPVVKDLLDAFDDEFGNGKSNSKTNASTNISDDVNDKSKIEDDEYLSKLSELEKLGDEFNEKLNELSNTWTKAEENRKKLIDVLVSMDFTKRIDSSQTTLQDVINDLNINHLNYQGCGLELVATDEGIEVLNQIKNKEDERTKYYNEYNDTLDEYNDWYLKYLQFKMSGK